MGKKNRVNGKRKDIRQNGHEAKKSKSPNIPDALPLADPLDINPENRVKYFRENLFPYARRMKSKEYYQQKLPLQVELVRLQNWVKESGKRVIILFEGRTPPAKGARLGASWSIGTHAAPASWPWTSRRT